MGNHRQRDGREGNAECADGDQADFDGVSGKTSGQERADTDTDSGQRKEDRALFER